MLAPGTALRLRLRTFAVFQLGGNCVVSDRMSLDFGVLAGHFDASPRAGVQLGFSLGL